jgi:Ribbon-helix-helix protein, copG family
MKRLQIMIDEDLDAALDRKARADGTSKAAIIRTLVRAGLRPLPPRAEDSLFGMVGVDSYDAPESIDDTVYS